MPGPVCSGTGGPLCSGIGGRFAPEYAHRQIARLLERFEGEGLLKTILDGYYHKLQERMEAGKTSLRSLRLALKPAVELLGLAHRMGIVLPDQRALDRYLYKTPGQRAAVSGFVKYLVDCQGVDVKLPPNDRQKQKYRQRKRLEQQLLQMMLHGVNGEQERRRWVNTALALFHKVPEAVCRSVPGGSIEWHDDGSCSVVLGGERYWVPSLNYTPHNSTT
jgi:hypothetical protein